MKSSSIPVSRQRFHKLNNLLYGAIVKDIDFTHWYKYISVIVYCTETIDEDDDIFPSCFYCVRFYGVRYFAIQDDTGCNLEQSDNNQESRIFLTGEIEEFTKEIDMNNKRYYRLKTSERKPNLEIHFDDMEIFFLNEIYDRSRLQRMDAELGLSKIKF